MLILGTYPFSAPPAWLSLDARSAPVCVAGGAVGYDGPDADAGLLSPWGRQRSINESG